MRLKERLIKLGSQDSSLRRHLLPIIKHCERSSSRSHSNRQAIGGEKLITLVYDWLSETMSVVEEKLKSEIDSQRVDRSSYSSSLSIEDGPSVELDIVGETRNKIAIKASYSRPRVEKIYGSDQNKEEVADEIVSQLLEFL
jgi:hypothetical protein